MSAAQPPAAPAKAPAEAPAEAPDAAPAAEALPPTARSLPIALLRAREKVMGQIRVMLAGAGVTEAQWRVLRVLDESGPMTLSGVAGAACLQAPSATRIIQALVGKGMVARLQDAGDRRRQVVSLRPAGRAVIRANVAQSRRIAQEVERRLGAARHAALLDLLEALERLDLGQPSDPSR